MPPDVVFIVDDDAAVRNGLKFLLSTDGYVVETFESAKSFLAAYDPALSGCLLLDVQMPGMTGLELQEELNRRGWTIPVIFITGHGSIPMAVEAIKAGAFDFIPKPFKPEELVASVKRALENIDENRADRLLHAQLKSNARTLTPREREILYLVADGETCKAIGQKLGISFRTVEGHRAHIIEKLHARGLSDLIRLGSVLKSSGDLH